MAAQRWTRKLPGKASATSDVKMNLLFIVSSVFLIYDLTRFSGSFSVTIKSMEGIFLRCLSRLIGQK
jgi:hypothetical protein